MKQARKKSKSAAGKTGSDNVPSTGGRRTQVRKSNVHGKGVYAVRPIKAGEMVLEYKGKIITWRKALALHPHDPSQPNHTFYFHLDDGHVIDGKQGGNSARWINHGCEPNLEAEQDGNRVFLRALRDIAVGEELLFDYALMIEGRKTAKVRKEYACFCGAPTCRGTMLHIKK
ncbi:MAG TPA: SET domain-containing protein-lysine N-methyltransferase [Smithellaceae bacterium]|jgi:SET domain-containing protein|nr:SET domain-containing protein-lysine N-methyltransferase [Smithellaceae bacterium]